MELILNLFWLLLTIPALWLWRNRGLRCHRGKHPFLVFLSLGCLLILLFPVISASDDLCAMRIEAVDPVTNDSLRSSAGRYSPTAGHPSAGFALPEAQFVATLGNPAWSAAIPTPAPKAGLRLAAVRVGRAPPLSTLEAR